MKFNLFVVMCQNEECGHEFVTNSGEHTSCPACGDNIVYSNDSVEVETNEMFESDIASFMSTKEGALVGVLVSLAYINGADTIARYDDNIGFRLNIKNSEYTKKVLEKINIKSISELEDLVDETIEDAHESLIIEPVIDCIERSSYCDEDGTLYESGEINFASAKKFYKYLESHNYSIAELLSK